MSPVGSRDILIWGLGQSGWGALILALKRGYTVCVSERKPLPLETRKWLQERNIPFEDGTHTREFFLRATRWIVKSPGIPPFHPLMQEEEIRQRVISDLEFGFLHTRGKVIAITGTNGKSTTTRLVYHLLYEAGFSVSCSGNIGRSFCLQVAENDTEWHVVEASSFQLAHVRTFAPEIAILLNIEPDHLDWHRSWEAYVQAKWNITRFQKPGATLILPASDSLRRIVEGFHSRATRVYVSYQVLPDQTLRLHTSSGSCLNVPRPLWERGVHPENVACAVMSALLLGVRPESIQKALSTFPGLPHRLEMIAEHQGIQFINDSKGTNPAATRLALQRVDPPIIWIAGGYEKGEPDYTALVPLVRKKVYAIVDMGKNSPRLRQTFSSEVSRYIVVENLKEAVETAWDLAQDLQKKNDSRTPVYILFSPACASFDQFQDYRERGEAFIRAVLDFLEQKILSYHGSSAQGSPSSRR